MCCSARRFRVSRRSESNYNSWRGSEEGEIFFSPQKREVGNSKMPGDDCTSCQVWFLVSLFKPKLLHKPILKEFSWRNWTKGSIFTKWNKLGINWDFYDPTWGDHRDDHALGQPKLQHPKALLVIGVPKVLTGSKVDSFQTEIDIEWVPLRENLFHIHILNNDYNSKCA